MKFSFYTLGCKVNQFETQAMEHRLQQLGHTLGAWTEPCDGFIINTCTVTAVSDKKSRNIIRRVRRLNPDAVVGVCGCYAQTSPDDVRKLDVDVLAGTADRMAFLDAVVDEAANRRRQHREFWEKAAEHRVFEVLQAGGLTARTRAMLKVQDGCCNFCSYCIIPYARGPIRSLPLSEAVGQARAAEAAGYRELVVTGIEISSWGADLEGKPGLAALLCAICGAVPQTRIRLGSLEPRTVTEDFCRSLAGFPNLCPQFHLSLQSGCSKTLRAMRRPYTAEQYAQVAGKLRAAFGEENVSLTTDVIVGFPGETEEDFLQSMAFVQAQRFLKVHVFPYSRRAGTPAYDFPDQTSEHEKEARSRRMTAAVEAVRAQVAAAMAGRRAEVLLETPLSANTFTGYTKQYLPVVVCAPGHASGDIVTVTLGEWDGHRCHAAPAEAQS